MVDKTQLRILKKGADAWSRWRYRHLEIELALSGANLSGVNLSRSWLSGVDLCGANLRGAELRTADLSQANLSGANLGAANLDMVDLRRANLRKANLAGATLRRANLRSADLRGADLSGANLGETILDGTNLGDSKMVHTTLGNVDLGRVRGLETVIHLGPSTLGVDTIYLSKGSIPEVFLRGAGVPDNFIEYMKSLVGSAIEYYSCFISYASKDEEFAERLYADLQVRGVRCWFAPHDVHGGRKLHEQIDQAIRIHERVLLILSEHSMNSEWVKTEIAKARKREAERGKQVLFPLRLVSFDAIRNWECFDADAGKDSAREIREYFIPDFSEWRNHSEYRQAFGRLMKDLKAADKRAGKV
jgi:hypothetical protein